MFTITREMLYFISLRQAYLLTPFHSSRISSRTVLFTSIPKRQLDEDYLRQVFQSVKRVWIVHYDSSTKDIVKKRDDCAHSLETALVQAVQNAVKADSKAKADHGRPVKRTIPLVGERSDAIDAYSKDLSFLQKRAEFAQKSANDDDVAATGAVFVEFETISAAQNALDATVTQNPLIMTPQSIGTVPSAVVWENLSIPAWEGIIRSLLATSFIVALTIFWSIPTSFIGVLSNIGDIADKVKFLHWINNLPAPVLGAIEGLLPALLLSYIVSLVPIICRYVARQGGEVTTAQIELKTQEWYFTFQVIQVFLVTTFSSGATAVVTELINDPKMAPELLAKRLPKASNFYLSYFIIYGFGQSTKNLMNWSVLFFNKAGSILDRTPRDKYERYTSLSGTGWGSWYPKFTNLAIIGKLSSYNVFRLSNLITAISYSCIAPLTLGFATVAFSFVYIVFRYNFFYVLQTSIDTQGRAYAKALQQLTVGIYTAEICLIGLFSLSVRRHNSSTGPLILMIIFTILTVVYHRIMHNELGPLTRTLPNNLVREREQSSDEEAGEGDALLGGAEPREQPSGLRGLFLKFFEPQKYASFHSNLRSLSKTRLGEAVPSIDDDKQESAYQHPSLTSNVPTLWIAKDELGTSKKLIEEVGKDIKVSDEGAWIDDKGKLEFDKENLRSMPIWKEHICY